MSESWVSGCVGGYVGGWMGMWVGGWVGGWVGECICGGDIRHAVAFAATFKNKCILASVNMTTEVTGSAARADGDTCRSCAILVLYHVL